MKKAFTKIMLLLIALVAGIGNAWAQTTQTFVAGTDTGSTSVTKGEATVSMSTMSRSDNYRTYANSNMTVEAATNYLITEVVVTCTANGTASYGPGNFSSSDNKYTYSGYKGTWSNSNGAPTVTLSASSQVRMTQIIVTYISSSGSGNTITAGTLSHVEIDELWDEDLKSISLGEDVAQGTAVYMSFIVDNGYTMQSVTVKDANDNDVTVNETQGAWLFTMPNSSVTIDATATQNSPIIGGSKYVKVTTDNIPDGQYLIVYEDGSLAFNGSLETLDAAGNTISVSISNNIITATTATADAEFTINTNNNVSTIQSASGYYIGNNSDSNALSSSTTIQYTNTISIDESGNAVVVSSGGAYLRYNSASNQTRFRYFKSATYTGQQAIQLYKKVDYTITISPYSNTTSKDGWYLIASPVSAIPTEVTNMIHSDPTTHGYDLYRFNQSNASNTQWENYKNHTSGFNITPGQGYLYANSQSVILGFSGTAYSEEGTFNLIFDENVENNAQGWNLMGNPFSTTAYADKDFYVMNEDGSELSVSGSSSTPIPAMNGIFVHATEANQKVTFSTSEPGKSRNNNALVINLNRNDNVIDRAIVRFGESEKLSKFQLFEGSTKIYIPQNGADYAIVAMDDNTQAFSLNFHAKTTGKYTLSLGETSNLSYVHLFDCMTGEDIDMLLEDSYSFIGSPADSEERFIVRLSYNASSTGSETFAYQSGNGIIVNGEGTLEVYDVTGRKVMTTTINGVQTVTGLNNGLYIFRLNEKTQKIVVR